MFDRELTLFAFNRAYLAKLTDDLTDEQLSLQPLPGLNPALWLLGHLAIANDYALLLLGRPMVCSKAWHRDFGPNSTPLAQADAPPTKRELLDAFEQGAAATAAAAKEADPAKMAGPHRIEFLRGLLPTAGDMVAHLMTTHLATHIGQLSSWRRAAGLPRVPFTF